MMALSGLGIRGVWIRVEGSPAMKTVMAMSSGLPCVFPVLPSRGYPKSQASRQSITRIPRKLRLKGALFFGMKLFDKEPETTKKEKGPTERPGQGLLLGCFPHETRAKRDPKVPNLKPKTIKSHKP